VREALEGSRWCVRWHRGEGGRVRGALEGLGGGACAGIGVRGGGREVLEVVRARAGGRGAHRHRHREGYAPPAPPRSPAPVQRAQEAVTALKVAKGTQGQAQKRLHAAEGRAQEGEGEGGPEKAREGGGRERVRVGGRVSR